MRCIQKIPCAGGRRPVLAIHHGDGIADTLIQTIGRAAGKVAAAAPAVAAKGAQKLLAAGKAAVVPAATRLGQAAGQAVAKRAADLLHVTKKDAALPSTVTLPPSERKAVVEAVQKRAQALLRSANVSNLIHGQGLRLSPY